MIKYANLMVIQSALRNLSNEVNLPANIKIQVYKLSKEINLENECLQKTNRELIEKYVQKDNNGNKLTCIKFNNSVFNFGENEQNYNIELDDLLNTEIFKLDDLAININAIDDMLPYINVYDLLTLEEFNLIKFKK